MDIDRRAWLRQVEEAPLEPGRPICDAHHHLWERPGSRYLIDELAEDAAELNVVSTVFVECMAGYREAGPAAMRPVGETSYIESIAASYGAGDDKAFDCCAAIIGYADLRLGAEVQTVLEAHGAASPGRYRGIRHAVGWGSHPDVPISHTKPTESLLLDPIFREGIATLARLGQIYEVYLYHTQLLELADLARAFPGLRIVMNHLGGPLGVGPYAGDRAGVMAQWKKGVDAVAACENVVCKLGGIAMPRNGFGWHERDRPPGSEELAEVSGPWYRYCIERFGPGRCMFESNFPVEKQSCSYTVLWNSFERIAAPYSEGEKSAMFHDVAVELYGI